MKCLGEGVEVVVGGVEDIVARESCARTSWPAGRSGVGGDIRRESRGVWYIVGNNGMGSRNQLSAGDFMLGARRLLVFLLCCCGCWTVGLSVIMRGGRREGFRGNLVMDLR